MSSLDDGKYLQAVRCETVAAIYQVDAEELRQAAQRKFDGTATLNREQVGPEEEPVARSTRLCTPDEAEPRPT